MIAAGHFTLVHFFDPEAAQRRDGCWPTLAALQRHAGYRGDEPTY